MKLFIDEEDEIDDPSTSLSPTGSSGGICLRMVIRKFMQAELGQETGQNNETSQAIEKIIKDFVSMNLQIQHTENPSGSFSTGGIGEPKLLLNGKPFEESWGRPQNVGSSLIDTAL